MLRGFFPFFYFQIYNIIKLSYIKEVENMVLCIGEILADLIGEKENGIMKYYYRRK
jgi:hypothetical protein